MTLVIQCVQYFLFMIVYRGMREQLSLSLSFSLCVSLSLPSFNGHFPGEPGFSRCVLKQRMMEVVLKTVAIICAKLQSNHRHQQTNIQFLQAGCPSCHPTNSVKALKGKMRGQQQQIQINTQVKRH